MCDPFNENIVYFGGVSLFRATVGASAGTVENYQFEEDNTGGFLFLQSFSDSDYDHERIVTGTPLSFI
jgi:hypothetical protein